MFLRLGGGWLAGAAMVVAVGAVIFFQFVYTPTTSAFAVNDTSATVTLDKCADNSVTLRPGTKEPITPFSDAARGVCTAFAGGSDLGRPIGCLYLPSSSGHVIAGMVVRLSAMRPPSGANCP